MSEYQFYEFAAVDQPLSAQQQAELRSCSSRASISASGFVNEYNWGDLKGDPKKWMERYFDAHVYYANWGTCTLMLRLPHDALDEATLRPFLAEGDDSNSDYGPALTAERSANHWILTFSVSEDGGDIEHLFGAEGRGGWMARMLPLRNELARGDLRPLYVGWLARLHSNEFGADDLEPPLPAGMQALTPAQEALAEFLGIDGDLMVAAAAASAPLAQASGSHDAWIAAQDVATLRATVLLLLQGAAPEAERDVRKRFAAWERGQPGAAAAATRRRVAQIEAEAATVAQVRKQQAQVARKEREARQQRERAAFLQKLLTQADVEWAAADAGLQRGVASGYDQALKRVQDLADAHAQAGTMETFRQGMADLMARHGQRRAWVERLRKANIQW